MRRIGRITGPGGALLAVLSLVACGAGDPGPSTTELLAPPKTAPTSAAPAAAAAPCNDRLLSYAPRDSSASDAYVREIRNRGYLIAGVSADTLQLGARNPATNQIEGFDTDMARYVADAIFGDSGKVRFRVITAGQRIPLLKDGSVDIVARAMTMTCARWTEIAFSSQYYQAGQTVLVRSDSTAKGLGDLDGRRVCVQSGTTTLDNTREQFPNLTLVPAATATDCLVLFQQGDVDAITSDDTILAGLAAQDPYAKIPAGKAITEEPYGLGISQKQKGFARFVNGVLEDVRSDGRWQRSYNKWLEPELGSASPPKAQYGRS